MQGHDAKTSEIKFNLMYENICDFIAVSKVGDRTKTIQGLIKLCLSENQNIDYENAKHFCNAISEYYGLYIDESELNIELDRLEKQGILLKINNKKYKLEKNAKEEIKNLIKGNIKLENEIKNEWQRELRINYSKLDTNCSWVILQEYLNEAFRIHGVQATALLDPTISNSDFDDKSLTEILNDNLNKNVLNQELKEAYKLAISDFMANVGSDQARAQYISQLADGAFNFFSINISPEISYGLIKELNELTLLLDTNFLFGILDLHDNSQVQVSRDLIKAIKKHNLPFKLVYHPATEIEIQNTLKYHSNNLKLRTWSQTLSKAALESGCVSGIEQKFHEKNALNQIDVKEFLRAYDHFDVLLKNQDIFKFDGEDISANEERILQLFSEYNQYLELHNRYDKPENSIMHDVTLLEKAIRMRTDSKSSLDAKVLIISCDFMLYRFDKEHAKKNNRKTTVLLPNIFLQILRPYIPVDHDFNSAFASTFSLPEFRSISSGSEKACTKVLQILASYKDMPKETAIKILSNGPLLDALKAEDDDSKYEEKIHSVIIEENKQLLEERIYMAEEVKKLKEDRKEKEEEQKRERNAFKEKQKELETQIDKHKINADNNFDKTKEVSHNFKVLLSTFISFVISTATLLIVNLLPWNWLINHQGNIAIQILFVIFITFIIFGFIVKKWRKFCFIAGFIDVLLSMIPLLAIS